MGDDNKHKKDTPKTEPRKPPGNSDGKTDALKPGDGKHGK